MSITPPTGILDITDAIVRVSKLEFRGATGFDTILNNVARNTALLVDQNVEYTTDKAWGLKLPNAWVSEFDAYWASGASGNIDFNIYNNTTSGTNGYVISMDDTTITVTYDGGSALETVSLGSTLRNDTWRKIHILFERDMISLALDGTRVLYFKDTLLRPRVYDEESGYVIASGLSADRKVKNLRILNGDKWMTDNSSNIAYVHGNVGIGTTQAAYTLDVAGDIRATGNLLIEGLTTTVDTQNLSIEDAIVEIGRGNDGGTSGKDVGFLFTRNNGTNTTNSNVALIYDESTDRLTFGYSDGSPTDSTLAINTSKSLDVVIPSGNLGIGTASPATKLDISLDSETGSSNTVGLTIRNYSSDHTSIANGFGSRIKFVTNRGTSSAYSAPSADIKGYIYTGAGSTGDYHALDLDVYGDNGSLNRGISILSQSSSGDPANTIMYGNVGVGTTNPGTPLHVSSANFISDTAGPAASANNVVRFSTTEADSTLLFGLSDTASYISSFDKSTFATERNLILNANGGNVGIGTVSPSTKLHVQGTSSSSVNWIAAFVNPYNSATTGQGSGIKLQLDGANAWYGDDKWSGITSIAEANWGDKVGMAFYTQGNLGSDPGNTPTEKMRISGSGNVGIGTTSPYGNLHVYTGGGGPSSADCLVIGDPNGSAAVNVRMGAASDYAWIQSHEGSPLRINPGGNTITYGNANTTLSDDRIKDNEEYIRDATQTLVKLKPQIYDKHLIWDLSSEDASNVTTVRESGLITQDVWYDAPELRYLVHLGREAHPSETKPYTDDDPQNDPDYSTWGNEPSTLNYTGLIPYLIKSNQELYTDLQAEKVKVATLETQLASVLARLDALESA
jgi:hypothetical protein